MSVEQYVTVRELAASLSCSADTVYRLAGSGRIPSLRVGRGLRFDVEAVREALATPTGWRQSAQSRGRKRRE